MIFLCGIGIELYRVLIFKLYLFIFEQYQRFHDLY